MAKSRLSEIRNIRLAKVKKLRKIGINPYPSKLEGKREEIYKALKKLGRNVDIAGRIVGLRGHGSSTFADLKDETGRIQLFFQDKNLKKQYSILKLLDIGDFVWVKGKVIKTKAGEVTVDVIDFQLLTKSIRPLPSTWHGLKDVEERYRQRYVDLLMNKEVRDVFLKKAKVISILRNYLDKKGFLEVKTPALQPIYGGATAKPFITHHNALDIDMYLRISDELYLKRLIAGGFEKVYEICTDFRNEGIDRWHNPEFTMLEFYWAYADYHDLMKMTEDMLSHIAKQVTGSNPVKYGEKEINFQTPWKRITFRDAIKDAAGIDINTESVGDLKKKIKDKNIKIDLSGLNDTPSVLDVLHKAIIRPNITNPTFLIDHPYEMRPLAKRHSKDVTKVESFQLICAGAELINAYSELNDPQDQKERWMLDMERGKKGAEEYQVLDEDYIRALEYGMPPTAGWGLGVDRFTAILTNQHSLKDVILFPTLRPV